jgi:UDP-glucose 4-epimerase
VHENFNVAILRYFNPIGAHKSGLIGEDPNGIPNNLVPFITQVAIGKRSHLNVFGNDYATPDGTGVRDYIHVCDLAKGHLLALNKLFSKSGLVTYNLGTGKGYSVLEVHHAMEKACGFAISYKVQERRPGDIAQCYAKCDKAEKELGFRAEFNIDDMCQDSWNWQKNNPNGYKNN